MKHYVWLVGICLVWIQCSVSSKVPGKYATQKLSQEEITRHLDSTDYMWDWIRMRTSIDMQSEDYNGKVKTLITMRKDSVIWMRLSKVAVEAARIKLTPDSVWIVDKINKEYLAEPYSYFQERFSVFLPFGDLQRVILGQAILPEGDMADFEIKKDNYKCVFEDAMQVYTIHLHRSTLLPAAQKLVHHHRGTIDVKQSEYFFGESQPPVPTERHMRILTRQGPIIQLHWSQTQITWDQEGSTRIHVPSHFAPMKI